MLCSAQFTIAVVNDGAMGPQGPKGDTGASGTSYWRNQGWIDLTSSEYAVDTWYPVVGSSLSSNGTCRIKVSVQLNSGTKPSWSTHASGFSVDLEVEDQRSGWGTTDAYCLKYIDTFKFCSVSPASYTQLTYGSIPVLFLRGGGKYYVSTDFVCTWTRYTTTYTWQSGTVCNTLKFLKVINRNSPQ